MSWAAIAKSAAPSAAPADVPPPTPEERVAVVDTNAIISGLRLEAIADRFCTIPEVLAEVRDKQSRQFLSTLPFGLDVRDPSEESLKAVQRFARETGDIHSLSTVDLKLLALAHHLEVAAHGSGHLREHPVQVRTRQRHKTKPRALPGWGRVDNPEDWKEVDEAPEHLLSNAPGAQSRIIAGVSSLVLGDEGEPGAAPAAPASAADGEAAPAAGSVPSLPLPPAPAAESQPATDASAGPGQGAGPQGSGEAAAGPGDEGSDGEEDEDDDDGWSTAAKSRNAARRKQRKARRQEAWEQTQQQLQAHQQRTEAGAAASTSGRAPAPAAAGPAAAAAAAPAAAAAKAAAPAAANGGADAAAADEGSDGEDGEGESGDEGEEGEGEMEEHEGLELVTDSDYDEGEEEGEDAATGADGTSTAAPPTTTAASTLGLGEEEEELAPNTTSNVFCVTADFAMQNVMLQMGLRLVSRDGKQITRVSRWALRCSACFFVTKEAGRVFCPRCGNLTMDRVEVTVGPGGAEFFGVRKKFILRGTRYSLPKPRGGRAAAKNPILREDVMLARAGRQRKKKPAAAAAGEVDPFVPEYGTETWHKAGGGRAGGRGPAPAMTNWRNNPNEVKPQRKSRRK
ncbi:hypothetical protein HYH03_000325 [Edaphochlamys debaryana]|uniref:RNA-binding protein NOB1 n=1 Tax=Edaphochlamys debaryana TaxID=47281 RepID=A0A835YFX8_9CHLO|nr:hypothetical protein HYH03_000325 [Edaphochlamys debaryana]|eukprot:KAG2501826.1 hypothetical protein HYH03_000325 [Edaphochlamys debaryana]